MSAGKPTTCKDAIRRWEEENGGTEAAQATEVSLNFQWPPIERMDNSLAALVKCEKLTLSTNMIEKISGERERIYARYEGHQLRLLREGYSSLGKRAIHWVYGFIGVQCICGGKYTVWANDPGCDWIYVQFFGVI